MEEPQQKRKMLEYKWVIIAICFLMMFTSLGFCSSNKSLYTFAITEALGIPRSVFSINDSFRFITTSIVNIFFGETKISTKALVFHTPLPRMYL